MAFLFIGLSLGVALIGIFGGAAYGGVVAILSNSIIIDAILIFYVCIKYLSDKIGVIASCVTALLITAVLLRVYLIRYVGKALQIAVVGFYVGFALVSLKFHALFPEIVEAIRDEGITAHTLDGIGTGAIVAAVTGFVWFVIARTHIKSVEIFRPIFPKWARVYQIDN